MKTLKIDTEFIKLGQFLKAADIISTGGMDCSRCQSHPCCCPDIQIENYSTNTSNPNNTNTINPTNTNNNNPIFNINITVPTPTPTPTPEPDQECECIGMVNIPNEINAKICTNNCSLEGSTVVAFGMVGIVEEVDCLGNVMVARGSGVSDGQQFNFALTILDTGDAQDVYGYFATFPGSGNTFTAFNIVPGDEIVITPFGTSSQGVTTTSTSGTNKPDVVVDGTLIKVSTLKNKE